VRHFFEMTERRYRAEGYMGCLLGGLGQELSGVSEVFRRKIEECFSGIADRIGACLQGARRAGEIPGGSDPLRLASLLVDCWEGAALRSRLRGDAASLTAMLDFYFGALGSRRARSHGRTHKGPVGSAREADGPPARPSRRRSGAASRS
jgi:TetR/AcrR family transcriptional repressor of nem operon